MEENKQEQTNAEENNKINPEDLNKKNYVKITDTFYVQPLDLIEGEKESKFKILNPETGIVEERILTDEEKREIKIKELKDSKIKFHPVKNMGKITINKFGKSYKEKRNKRNRATKKSRKANRV